MWPNHRSKDASFAASFVTIRVLNPVSMASGDKGTWKDSLFSTIIVASTWCDAQGKAQKSASFAIGTLHTQKYNQLTATCVMVSKGSGQHPGKGNEIIERPMTSLGVKDCCWIVVEFESVMNVLWTLRWICVLMPTYEHLDEFVFQYWLMKVHAYSDVNLRVWECMMSTYENACWEWVHWCWLGRMLTENECTDVDFTANDFTPIIFANWGHVPNQGHWVLLLAIWGLTPIRKA